MTYRGEEPPVLHRARTEATRWWLLLFARCLPLILLLGLVTAAAIATCAATVVGSSVVVDHTNPELRLTRYGTGRMVQAMEPITLRDQRDNEVAVQLARDGKTVRIRWPGLGSRWWSPEQAQNLIKAIEQVAREAERRNALFRDMDGDKTIVRPGINIVNDASVPAVYIYQQYRDEPVDDDADDSGGDRVFSAAEARRLARAIDEAANEVEARERANVASGPRERGERANDGLPEPTMDPRHVLELIDAADDESRLNLKYTIAKIRDAARQALDGA